MIITDTSVWIEFFKSHEPYFTRHSELLENNQVVALSPIFGELLQGVKTNSEKSIILEYWHYLPKFDESKLFIKAGEYSIENHLISKGVGLIDSSIIVTAIEYGCTIWTLYEKINSLLPGKIKFI